MLGKKKTVLLVTAMTCLFTLTACTQTANYEKKDDTSKLLPVGSVVKVNKKGNMLIVSVGEILDNRLYDYKGCSYPKGCVGDNLYYFSKEDIVEIKHKGYDSDESKEYLDYIEKKMESIK